MTKFRIVLLIVTAQLFFSCIPVIPKPVKTELEPMPKFEIDPEALEFMKNNFVCDTQDSEMALTDFNAESTVEVKGSETVRDTETTDCDGTVKKSTSRIEFFDQSIDVNPDKELAQKLNFMSVENVRTCSTLKISASDQDEFELLKTANKTAKPGSKSSSASVAGNALIALLDSPLKSDKLKIGKINVANGNNVFKIRYLGKCLKYAEKIDDKKTDAENCLEAEVIAEKQILLKVSITRKISPLPALKVNSCKTNPTPQAE